MRRIWLLTLLLMAGCASMPPLYSHTRTADREERDYLWPLGVSNKLYPGTDREVGYWRFLNVYNIEGADDDYKFRIFPLYFQGRTRQGEEYRALFPLGGKICGFPFFTEADFVLFPIYGHAMTGDTETRTLLWPFYLTRHGGRIDQFRLFPIYGEREHRRDYMTERSHFVLWPFWSDTKITGDVVDGSGYMLFPLYGHSHYERAKRGTENTTYVIPPLFCFGRGDDGYRKINAPWPFVQIEDRDEKHRRVFWPLFGRYDNKATRRRCWLWPFFHSTVSHIETPAGGKTNVVERHYVHAPLPLYYHADEVRGGTNTTYSYSRVWPLYSHRDDGGNVTTRFPELSLWSKSEQVERNLAPIWSLYKHTEKPDGESRTSLLWGIVSWGRGADGQSHFSLFWL